MKRLWMITFCHIRQCSYPTAFFRCVSFKKKPRTKILYIVAVQGKGVTAKKNRPTQLTKGSTINHLGGVVRIFVNKFSFLGDPPNQFFIFIFLFIYFFFFLQLDIDHGRPSCNLNRWAKNRLITVNEERYNHPRYTIERPQPKVLSNKAGPQQ